MKSYTSEETQERLGISRPTLYLWVRQGKLKPHRTGRALRFDENEILGMLGQGPQVAAWIHSGPLESARHEVSRFVRSNVAPSLHLEYLQEPRPAFIRARVVSEGDGTPLRDPAPGGALFERLLAAKKHGDFVFLSHEESAWSIHDVRAETSPAGEPLVAVELTHGPGEGDERARRLMDFLLGLRVGVFEGRANWEKGDSDEPGAH